MDPIFRRRTAQILSDDPPPDPSPKSDQPKRFTTVVYATKAQVPYRKDDNFPTYNGAQGVVYRANRSYGIYSTRAFAIKEIHLRSGEERKKLENEIKHLRKCDHPNVLKLHEAFKIEDSNWADRYFLVTEPWADASLDRFFRDLGSSRNGTSSSCSWYLPGKLDPWPSIVSQCIAGIHHLHKNSIRHKDLKPSNILLVNESDNNKGVKVIIADLGISKTITIGAPTSFDGTKQYMAPEQLARKSSTTQSDIFSLGTCFAMIQAALCTKAGVRSWMTAKQNETGFFAVDKVATSRFAENIDTILNLLEQLCTEEEARAHPAKIRFHRTLQTMVQKMFIEDPMRRPTANELLVESQTSELQHSQDGGSHFINVYISTGSQWRWSNLHRIMVSDSTSDAKFIQLLIASIQKSMSKVFGMRLPFYFNIKRLRWVRFHTTQNRIFFQPRRRAETSTELAIHDPDSMTFFLFFLRYILGTPKWVHQLSRDRWLLDFFDRSQVLPQDAERHTNVKEFYYQTRGAEATDFPIDCLYIEQGLNPFWLSIFGVLTLLTAPAIFIAWWREKYPGDLLNASMSLVTASVSLVMALISLLFSASIAWTVLDSNSWQ